MPVRKGEASWKGSLNKGEGWIKTESGALEQAKYSFPSRFESGSGTNPEELIAAAHAGCFSMALALMLSEAGHEPEAIDTVAGVTIEKQGGGFAITGIHLKTQIKVEGMDRDEVLEHAEKAKDGCPVSQALKSVPMTLETEVV
ncbi:MAG: OsmC family protein [Spirochaetaceae bacterium]